MEGIIVKTNTIHDSLIFQIDKASNEPLRFFLMYAYLSEDFWHGTLMQFLVQKNNNE